MCEWGGLEQVTGDALRRHDVQSCKARMGLSLVLLLFFSHLLSLPVISHEGDRACSASSS